MSFKNIKSEDNMELGQKELLLALSILNFQCDSAFDGNFNKKLEDIDNQLLNMGSNRRTIDILSDLLIQLPSVIDTIKAIEILNDQETTKESIVEENKKVKIEVVNDDEFIENDGQNSIKNNEINASELFQNPESISNNLLLCQPPQRKAAIKANKALISSPASSFQQDQNLTQTQNILRDPKIEHHFYSSSENEEENEEEKESGGAQQSSSYKNCVQKVEQVIEEETVEIVPEVPKMSVDEIKKLAVENTKRNKRIRYFSNEDEDTGKKKTNKKDNKSPTGKLQENQKARKRGRPPKLKQINDQTTSLDQTKSLDQEKSTDDIKSKDGQLNSLQNEQNLTKNLTENQLKTIAGRLFEFMSGKELNNSQEFPDKQHQFDLCANNLNDTQKIDDQKVSLQNSIDKVTKEKDEAKPACSGNFTTNSNQMDDDDIQIIEVNNVRKIDQQMDDDDIQIIGVKDVRKISQTFEKPCNSVPRPFSFQQKPPICLSTSTAQNQQTPLKFFNTPILNPSHKKSICHVLKISSIKTVQKIEADQILISKNSNDETLINKLRMTCYKNARLLMQIKLDRFLIEVADQYWNLTGQMSSNNDKKKMSQQIDHYFKDFDISNSARLRNPLITNFVNTFGNSATNADDVFQRVISCAMDRDGVPIFMQNDCIKTIEILNGIGFFETLNNITSNRVKFLEFVKKKVECNYEIDFWISE